MTPWVPAPLASVCARRMRSAGNYSAETLAAYSAVWQRTGSPRNLLRYALFRRDLGRKVPRRWIAPLLAAAQRLRGPERGLALALVAEVDPGALEKVTHDWLETASTLPVLAYHLDSRRGGQSPLGELHAKQPLWQHQFKEWLMARQGAGVSVVGNAAGLQGKSLGARIDGAGAVVRFNLYRSAETSESDIGTRTDVWVLSPRFRGPCPLDAQWVVMSGPDMRYRLRDWHNVMPLLEAGRPVLTVPLAVWRALVSALEAPPSAGVLTLAWIRNLCGSWGGVTSVGIGAGLSGGGRYHVANPRQHAVSRHNWEAERALVSRWHTEGLEILLSADGSRESR